MQSEREKIMNTFNNEQIVNGLSNMTTTRESMLIKNREDIILQQIINLKASAKMLPITMRKLYAYKIADLDKKRKEKDNVIPLVLRKRMLLEKSC